MQDCDSKEQRWKRKTVKNIYKPNVFGYEKSKRQNVRQKYKEDYMA